LNTDLPVNTHETLAGSVLRTATVKKIGLNFQKKNRITSFVNEATDELNPKSLQEMSISVITDPREIPDLSPFTKLDVKGDGNCFYSRISLALTGSPSNHIFYRNAATTFVRSHWAKYQCEAYNILTDSLFPSPLDYRKHANKEGTYATQLEIKAIATIFMTQIRVIFPDNTQNLFSPDMFSNTVILGFHGNRDAGHFFLLSPRKKHLSVKPCRNLVEKYKPPINSISNKQVPVTDSAEFLLARSNKSAKSRNMQQSPRHSNPDPVELKNRFSALSFSDESNCSEYSNENPAPKECQRQRTSCLKKRRSNVQSKRKCSPNIKRSIITTYSNLQSHALKHDNTGSKPIIKTGPEAGQYFHVRPPIGFI